MNNNSEMEKDKQIKEGMNELINALQNPALKFSMVNKVQKEKGKMKNG